VVIRINGSNNLIIQKFQNFILLATNTFAFQVIIHKMKTVLQQLSLFCIVIFIIYKFILIPFVQTL
jgi:hypothetical protein